MKAFTEADLETVVPFEAAGTPYLRLKGPNGGRIPCELLERRPLWWHLKGLQETASGYGSKLRTEFMVRFEGRAHRVYCTLWSNSGTCYFVTRGRRVVIS